MLSFDMSVKTPDNQEKSLRRYVAEQAIVGFVIGRVFYCLCPLSGALLGAATAGSHVIRKKEILEKFPDPFRNPLLKINDTINKTALLAIGFFTSILCISLLTAPPLPFFKAAIVMGYVHNMGGETFNTMSELFANAYSKINLPKKTKEYLPKKAI
ncbi:hypothetical protein RHABOEDO_001155 [Candidatus Rhabdochlamydia oedothoracis]|uniref:Uncharacterized protein n=1 Tax=Candidatus Rhabdochlamydia oedothoracis TaxID=2720720 RepID=A0ABX8V238_9BACT|nr:MULTISPECIES: hypothetical protein [Rhabdochlamydia]KAG6559300.1 hypothetical protein RHOW815_000690 [Candidatus Rhabdochlamydia sp. W815]MCL6755604.1 hypothetical protein [Candidatus Rhabdochlamydia oedothoracis]QYF48916.1 hypothetical protein RHABOEDO_001155 [Candidatus Rhabdochlamydia oedothoracis]